MKYRSIHNWVVYNYGKASLCEYCGKSEAEEGKRTFCWSNKSGTYQRDRSDWQQLCYSCHKKYDYKRGGFKPWNAGVKGIQDWHNISGLIKSTPWNKGKKLTKDQKKRFKEAYRKTRALTGNSPYRE